LFLSCLAKNWDYWFSLKRKRERELHNTGIYYDTRVGAGSLKAMAGLNLA
jgi:hypothetical protein